MAGRKQHFIPQSLQRGFEARRSGAKTQVYVYPKGAASYLTSTEGVGAERDFYSNPVKHGPGSLDDQITDFESKELNAKLDRLRSIDHGPANSEHAAIVIAHLTSRAAHLRATMTSLMDGAFTQMRDIVGDVSAARKLTGIDSAGLISPVDEMISKQLSPLTEGLSDRERDILQRIVTFRVRERFDDLFLQTQGQLTGFLAESGNRIPGSVAEGHTKALSQSLVSQERVTILSKLSWRVVSVDNERLRFILPDCVAVAYNRQDEKFEPLTMIGSDDMVAVIMPISSRQLLIGGEIEFDIDAINEDFARSCFKFFISSRQDEQMSNLSRQIGDFMSSIDVQLIEGGLQPNTKPSVTATTNRYLNVRTPIGRLGVKMRESIVSIANETLGLSSLSSVDAIVVPIRLDKALETILNRTPNISELNAASCGIANAVKSDTQWRCRIIIPREIAEASFGREAPEDRRIVRRHIRMTLGRAHYLDCWIRCYPMIFEIQHELPWAQILLNLAFNSASQYFGGVASSGIDANAAIDAELLQKIATGIRSGLHGLEEVRHRYLEHKNVDRLLDDVVAPLDRILGFSATLSGFMVASDLGLRKDLVPMIVLEEAGLADWVELFGKDLASHYSSRDNWKSEDELAPLSGHAERLLWTIGVFVTLTPEGHWIDVFDDERLARLHLGLRQ